MREQIIRRAALEFKDGMYGILWHSPAPRTCCIDGVFLICSISHPSPYAPPQLPLTVVNGSFWLWPLVTSSISRSYKCHAFLGALHLDLGWKCVKAKDNCQGKWVSSLQNVYASSEDAWNLLVCPLSCFNCFTSNCANFHFCEFLYLPYQRGKRKLQEIVHGMSWLQLYYLDTFREPFSGFQLHANKSCYSLTMCHFSPLTNS